jgi:hypothetical protein
MTKLTFATLACVFVASAAFAALGDVVASFPAPADKPIALATTDNYNPVAPGHSLWGPTLWVYCDVAPYNIYITDTYGVYIHKFQSPVFWATRGLTFSTGRGGLGPGPRKHYLWIGNDQQDKIYRCHPWRGTPDATFPANHDMGGGLAAMAVQDNGFAPVFMLSSDNLPKRIYRQKTKGGPLKSFVPSAIPFDLAWDWRNRLIWTGNSGNRIYGYRTNGSLYASFTIPSIKPRDLEDPLPAVFSVTLS